MSTESNLQEHQHLFVHNVREVIKRNYISAKPFIRILDAGCDPSGEQLKQIANLVSGDVYGINIADEFPSEQAQALAKEHGRVHLMRMDGMKMNYDDAEFDLVISANVMEHISDPGAYIRECARVLKPNGVAYFETYPVWSGPRGHHIMQSMVEDWIGETTPYRNDGTYIPDWGHINLSADEMRQKLQGRLNPTTIECIVHYMYEDRDINRAGWKHIQNAFNDAFKHTKISTSEEYGADQSLQPTDDRDAYDVAGFQAVCWKNPPRSQKLSNRMNHELRRRLHLFWKYQVKRGK